MDKQKIKPLINQSLTADEYAIVEHVQCMLGSLVQARACRKYRLPGVGEMLVEEADAARQCARELVDKFYLDWHAELIGSE